MKLKNINQFDTSVTSVTTAHLGLGWIVDSSVISYLVSKRADIIRTLIVHSVVIAVLIMPTEISAAEVRSRAASVDIEDARLRRDVRRLRKFSQRLRAIQRRIVSRSNMATLNTFVSTSSDGEAAIDTICIFFANDVDDVDRCELVAFTLEDGGAVCRSVETDDEDIGVIDCSDE